LKSSLISSCPVLQNFCSKFSSEIFWHKNHQNESPKIIFHQERVLQKEIFLQDFLFSIHSHEKKNKNKKT